jgi:hypothetical protein
MGFDLLISFPSKVTATAALGKLRVSSYKSQENLIMGESKDSPLHFDKAEGLGSSLVNLKVYTPIGKGGQIFS